MKPFHIRKTPDGWAVRSKTSPYDLLFGSLDQAVNWVYWENKFIRAIY